MARPPAAEKGQKTKTFTVAPHHKIGGNDGKAKKGGEQIELTHKQAQHLLKLGAIVIDLPDFDDEDDKKEDTNDTGTSGSTAKAVDEPSAEGKGDAAGGGAPDKDGAEGSGDAASRRPKRSL